MTEPIKVLLADDENLIRSALAMMLSLEDDIVVVAEAESGEDAVVAAAKHQPDVARARPSNGRYRRHRDGATDCADGLGVRLDHRDEPRGVPGYLKKALSAGVRGFLPKTTPAATLAEVVRSVHAGGRYVDPSLAAEAIGAGDSPLTPREADVLEYAADGASIEQIASRAHLSAGTTRNYLSSAVTKLGAANRHEAAVIARRQGWI